MSVLESTSDPILTRLKAGVRRFQAEVHAERANEYRKLATRPQRPHTLAIACADSRVDFPSLTSSGPGEVFNARNIGNMVPTYGDMLGGVSAVIEYAVTFLQVGHIVVCGHSDCGAMKGLLDPASTASMPTVRSWLTNGHAALRAAEHMAAPDATPEQRLDRLTEENVLLQLRHLTTHPSVTEALRAGTLTLSGWVYEIATGSVRVVEAGSSHFVPIEESLQGSLA